MGDLHCSCCWVQTLVAEHLHCSHCWGGRNGMGAEAGDAARCPSMWSILCSGGLLLYLYYLLLAVSTCCTGVGILAQCAVVGSARNALGTQRCCLGCSQGRRGREGQGGSGSQPAAHPESCGILPVAKGLILDMEQCWFT